MATRSASLVSASCLGVKGSVRKHPWKIYQQGKAREPSLLPHFICEFLQYQLFRTKDSNLPKGCGWSCLSHSQSSVVNLLRISHAVSCLGADIPTAGNFLKPLEAPNMFLCSGTGCGFLPGLVHDARDSLEETFCGVNLPGTGRLTGDAGFMA